MFHLVMKVELKYFTAMVLEISLIKQFLRLKMNLDSLYILKTHIHQSSEYISLGYTTKRTTKSQEMNQFTIKQTSLYYKIDLLYFLSDWKNMGLLLN